MGVFQSLRQKLIQEEHMDRSPESSGPDGKKADPAGPRSLSNGDGLGQNDNTPHPFVTWRTFMMGLLVSMGGLIFGYDTGQISGFLEIQDFLRRFGQGSNGDYSFSDLSIGTLVGALIAAPLADKFGRRLSISGWCIVFCLGVIIQMAASSAWEQVMMGRFVAGLGVGALSVLVPLFQSETAPSHIRGAIVCCYQLFVTLGILFANIVNYGTERISNSASWRIPMGIGFLWAIVLGIGILSFPETPKHAFRKGRPDEARETMRMVLGVGHNHRKVELELREMKAKLDAENAGAKAPWWEIFTGPRMAYRTILGITLQAFKQLTGVNFFFYYGTTILVSTGLSNSFVTQIILGTVNVACTFPGLWGSLDV
ncbi:MAG: hypothetical protein Q9166_002135 [cf. Caloplaca sp. 2 TL-2023]